MQMSQAVGQFLIALVRRGLMGLLLAMLPLWAQAQSQGGTADLQITKSGPTRANGGDKVEYQLVMDNNGPNDASGATFVDMLPAGLTNVVASCVEANPVAACPTNWAVSNSAVSGTLSTFPNLANVVVQITGNFAVSGASSLTNTASITPAPGMTDPMPDSNQSSISTSMSYVADLVVTKTQSSDVYVSGAPVTYSMTVTNIGPSAADGALLSDYLMPGGTADYMKATLTFVRCTATGGAECPDFSAFANYSGSIYNPQLFSVTVPKLPSKGVLTIVYDMVAQDDRTPRCDTTAGEIRNNFSATVPRGVVDPNGNNNSAQVVIRAPAAPACPVTDLAVTKSQSTNTYVSGAPVTYTMTVTNIGPSDADGALLSDSVMGDGTSGPLLADFVYGSCSPTGAAECPDFSPFATTSGGTYVPQLFSVYVPKFPVGTTLTITYTMTARDGAAPPCGTQAGAIRNTFSATPTNGVVDRTPNNNTAVVSIPTPAAAACPKTDLAVTKTQSTNVLVPGVPFKYTMTVVNNGPSAADGTLLSDDLMGSEAGNGLNIVAQLESCEARDSAQCPPASEFGQMTGGNYAPALISAYVPKLPSGGSLTIVYSMTATYVEPECRFASGSIENRFGASVPRGVDDTNGNNNSARTSLPFTCTNVSVNKTVAPVSTMAGMPVTYTVDVTNAGPGTTNNVAFSDPLPLGFVYSDASCSIEVPTTTGTVETTACGPVSYNATTQTVSSTIPSLGNKGAVRFAIHGKSGTTAGTFRNTAYAVVAPGVVDPVQDSNQSFVNLQISNTRSPVTITKNISGLGSSGLPAAQTFTGSITCGTQPVQTWSATVAAGTSSANSATLSFFDGDTCTVTEDTPPTPPAGYAWSGGPTISPNPAGPLGTSTPITINVTNTLQRLTGAVTVTKQFTGPSAAVGLINGTFSFDINCGVDGTFAADVSVANGVSASSTVNNLPAQASCTVTETVLANAPSQYAWGAETYTGNPVLVTADGNAVVTVTNPLLPTSGVLTITKTVSGGPTGGVSGAFVFAVSCMPSNTAIANPTITLTKASTGTVTVPNIPAGDTCAVTEQTPPAAPAGYTWGATPGPVSAGPLTANGTLNATITNTLKSNAGGSLTIDKTVSGGPSEGVSAAFVFAVSCVPSNTTIANQTITLTKATSGSVTVPNIPVGDTCTVTEKTPPDAPIDYLWGALPAPVVTGPMAEGGTLKAAVLNTLHLGSNGGGRGLVQPVPAGGLWSYLLLAMALAWWGMRRVANKRVA